MERRVRFNLYGQEFSFYTEASEEEGEVAVRMAKAEDVDALLVLLEGPTDWQHLNLNYVEKAVIDQDLCIKCGRCHVVCEDTSHQAITSTINGERRFEVIDEECVGCNLCVSVCPVDGCITMERLAAGTVDPRTGQPVPDEHGDWTTHPNNPMRVAAE